MPTFILRAIDPALWLKVQAKATAEGITVKTLILKAIAQYVAVGLLCLLTNSCQNAATTSPAAMPFSAATPTTLTLSTFPGGGSSTPISARVQNGLGTNLPGVTVQFTTDVGTLSASAGTTIADGTVTVTLTTTAAATVTATTGALIAHASVLSPLVAAAPGALVVALTVVPGYAGSDSVLSVSVKNGTGIPLTAWTFGDGGSQAAQRSTSTAHTYAAAGTYPVLASVTDPSGTTASAAGTASIPTAPPAMPPPPPAYLVTLGAAPTSVLIGGSATLTAAVTPINGAPAPTSYGWDCQGTGTLVSSSTPTHACVYPTVGSITSKVTVTGGSVSGTASMGVSVSALPVPGYSVGLSGVPTASILVNTQVNLTATATPQNGAPPLPTHYAWTFGDGISADPGMPNELHTYGSTPGTYTVTVTVNNGTAVGSASASIVTIAMVPVVTVSCPSNWVVNATTDNTCNVFATLNTVVVPSAMITNVFWDFGDGTTANKSGNVSPPHMYTAAEMFTIVAVVTVVGETGTGTGTVVTTILPM